MKTPRPSSRLPEPTSAPTTARTGPAYHHGQLRQALIDAGLQFLRTHPYEALSLRDLARSVGVSANAAYRHFEDKAALLGAIAAAGFEAFGCVQAQVRAEHADPARRFRASGLAYIRFARDNPSLFRLMFGGVDASSTNADLVRASGQALQGLMEGAAQGLGLGMGDARTLTSAAQAWATVHGLSHLVLDGRLQALSADVDALIEAVLDQMKVTLAGQAASRGA